MAEHPAENGTPQRLCVDHGYLHGGRPYLGASQEDCEVCAKVGPPSPRPEFPAFPTRDIPPAKSDEDGAA